MTDDIETLTTLEGPVNALAFVAALDEILKERPGLPLYEIWLEGDPTSSVDLIRIPLVIEQILLDAGEEGGRG